MTAIVTLHYRRLYADYDGWDLWLWGGHRNLLVSQVRPGRHTAFGAIFRFDASALFPGEGEISSAVGVLPRFGEWVNSDKPEKYIAKEWFEEASEDGLHMFMIEGDAQLYTSPVDIMLGDSSRFLCVQIDKYIHAAVDKAAMDPWVLAYDQAGVRKEFFPGAMRLRKRLSLSKGIICLVDGADFFGNDIFITICTSVDRLANPTVQPHAVWKVSDKANFLSVSVSSAESYAKLSNSSSDFRAAVLQEAMFVSGDSTICELADENTPAEANDGNAIGVDLPLPHFRRRNFIKVYYQRLDRKTHAYSLTVHSVVNPSETRTISRENKLYRDSAVFLIDLNSVPYHVLEDGLVFTPVAEAEKVAGSSVTWRRESGLSVILAESYNELLLPANVDVSVQYHRFGDCADWADWELLAWTEAVDQYDARSISMKSSLHLRSGVILFDMTGVLFRRGAVVHVQPVKKVLRPGKWHTGLSGEHYQGEPYHEIVFRDVVRRWTSGDLTVPQIHLIQGDFTCYSHAPEPSLIAKDRFFRLRYMRHTAGDYDDWDLWTWENQEGTTTSVAIASEYCATSGNSIEFIVDRANYGAGATINLIPRHGGDAWDVKDEPVRIWKSAMIAFQKEISGDSIKTPISSGPVTYIILEGSSLILKRLDDVRSMLTAQVNHDGHVLLSAPAPLSWFYPDGIGKSLQPGKIGLRFAKGLKKGLHKLIVRRLQPLSPAKILLMFENTPLMDEDFPVESIIVSVPGFNNVPLMWCKHDSDDMYYYQGELGLSYSPQESVFRCFAPRADFVSVVLYDAPTGNAGRAQISMRRIPEGCWKVSVRKDLRGRFYKLLAEGDDKLLFPGVEVLDPYSRCNSSHVGRGLIYGEEKTPVAPRPDIPAAETIVYELHIRDATIDECSGVQHKGKYLGLTEHGTKIEKKSDLDKIAVNEAGNGTMRESRRNHASSSAQGNRNGLMDKFSTSLDHIIQMGVTAVQIMPVQDFDNDETDENAYRWGYMPVHFNSPDGWYASSVTTVARITELKLLINALHKAGLKVIMDVVYNHTAEDSNERNLDARFSFNGLAPRYYYRTCGNTPKAHTGDSTCALRNPGEPTCGACYSNGSGCGNEFRSESPMGRKFIIDSLCYWANEYQVDGFRFDLLGLIDLETITLAGQVLREIDPNIVLYGEPWVGGLTPIRMTDKGSQRSRGFSVFNNTFRDAIRGSPFGAEETFVMDGGRLDEVKRGLIGSIDDFCDSPLESINYVECHDNYTLWDHMQFYIKSRTDDIEFTNDDLRRMHRLSAVIVFTAQGIPFLQIGQEMCRTKFGVENSYESPDEINKIRWENKIEEWKTVRYYRGLIQIRRAHPEIFALCDSTLVRNTVLFYEDLGLHVPQRCIAFRVSGNPPKLLKRLIAENDDIETEELREESEKWRAIVVILNPTPEEVVVPLPEHSHDAIWMQIVDENYAGLRQIQGPLVGSLTVPGRAAAILRKASDAECEKAQVQLRLACVTDAYSVPGGDDGLTAYAVSLRRVRSASELRTNLDLVARRKQFESSRATPILSPVE